MARFTMAANGTLIRQMPRAPTGIREVSPAPDKVLYWDNVKDLVRSFRAPLTDMPPFRGGNPAKVCINPYHSSKKIQCCYVCTTILL